MLIPTVAATNLSVPNVRAVTSFLMSERDASREGAAVSVGAAFVGVEAATGASVDTASLVAAGASVAAVLPPEHAPSRKAIRTKIDDIFFMGLSFSKHFTFKQFDFLRPLHNCKVRLN
jgi:hypothetical protein